MSRFGCVISLGVLMTILLLAGGIALCDPLTLHLEASGDLDARLLGLAFSATLEGEGTFDGTAPCDDGVVCLTATSEVIGVGVYDILNLATKGWILASASGVTATGQAFSIQTVAFVSRLDGTPLQIGDLFEGVHHTRIHIGDVAQTYQGSFSGTITGGVSTKGTNGLLQLVGSGRFTLTGERISMPYGEGIPSTIPLDDPDLPADFLRAIREAFL